MATDPGQNQTTERAGTHRSRERADVEPLSRAVYGWRAAGLLLLLALALAAGLRLCRLGAEDFWLDEIHSLVNSAGRRAEFEAFPHGVIVEAPPRFTEPADGPDGWSVWRGMTADAHPPLYFVLLRTWRQAFGESEATLRFPSAVFSILSILAVVAILWRRERRWAAVAATAILAVAYGHLHLAQQARPYSLGMLFVAVSYWALTGIEDTQGARRWRGRGAWLLLYGASTLLAAMTHYFTVIAMAGQVPYACWRIRGRLRLAVLGTACLAALAFALVWGGALVEQYFAIRQYGWIYEHDARHVWWTILRAADLPLRLLFAHEPFRHDIWPAVAGTALLVLMALQARAKWRIAAVFFTWYSGSVAVFTAIDLITGRQVLAHVRYVCVAVPALAGLGAVAWDSLGRRPAAVAAMAFAIAVGATLRLPATQNPENREAASRIADAATPRTLLIFDAIDWPPYWVFQMYHNVAYYLAGRPEPRRLPVLLLREPPNEALVHGVGEFDRVIILSPRVDCGLPPVPVHFVPTARSRHFRQLGWITVFQRDASPGAS